MLSLKKRLSVICILQLSFVYVLFSGFHSVTKQLHFFPKLLEVNSQLSTEVGVAKKIDSIQNPCNVSNSHQINIFIPDSKHALKKRFVTNKVSYLHKKWASKLRALPAFDKNKVYVFKTNGRIECYIKDSDQLVWSYKIVKNTKKEVNYTVCVHNQHVMCTTLDSIFVLNSQDGREMLYKTFSSPITSSPVVDDATQTLYLQTALNLHQVNLNYMRELKYKEHGIAPDISVAQNVICPVLYEGGVLATHIYNKVTFCSPSRDVCKLPIIETLLEKMQQNTNATGISCQPILSGDELLVCSSCSKIIKYDLKKGKVAWQFLFPGVKNICKVANTIFAVSYSNQICALNFITGQPIWVKNLPSENNNEYLSLFVVNSELYVVSKSSRRCFVVSAQDGKVVKNISFARKMILGGNILSILPVDDSIIVFTSKKAVKLI